MTVQQLDTAFSNVIKDLQGNGLGNIMAQVGASARQKIYERIHKRGENAEGGKFASSDGTIYSTKDMLVGDKTFRKKDSSKFFNDKNIEWKSIRKPGINKPTKGKHNKKADYWRLAVLKGGYKKLRELSGLQSGFVDFAFTGTMWPTIQLRKDRAELNKGIASIGAISDNKTTNAKLEGNTKRKGEILKLSASEITEITEQFDNEIEKLLQKNGLA